MPESTFAASPSATAATGPASPTASASAELSVLVVDPHPGMRASLQNMLNQAGIGKVEFAVSASTAIAQLARRAYDVVLCEVDLGGQDGQDGQHLLEDLRQQRLITPRTIFIILTAEAVHGKVVSAAELAPSDYILKPFTIDALSRRIERALDRRAALQEVHRLTEAGDLRAALRLCAAPAARQSRHGPEFARLGAELQLQLGQLDAAAASYRAILAERPRGWASLGLARVLIAQQQHHEAAQLLDDLVGDNPRLMAAYDLLAQCHAAQGAPARAQRVLQDAVSISPHLVGRLRSLGEMALAAGDVGAAEKSFRQVVARARYSAFRDPEDHVNLVRVLVRKGDAHLAAPVIRDLEKSLRAGVEVDACKAYCLAMVHEAGGDIAATGAALAEAVQAALASATLSARLKISLARSCLQHRIDDAACAIVISLLSGDGAGAGTVSAEEAVAVFTRAGRADLAEGMGRQLGQQAEDMIAVAAEQSRGGDVKAAVHTMLEANRKSPANLAVGVAAASVILRQLDSLGWDHQLGERAVALIDSIARREPGHAQVKPLQEALTKLRRKYGIAA